MRITTLQAHNFKGQTFSHDLAPVTVFTGDNSVGKSSRLEALDLAWRGYATVDGKQVRDSRAVFDLYASGPEMGVGFLTDGPVSVDRTWKLVGDSVSYSGPKGPTLPEAASDPAAYLALSGPERLKFLFAATGAASGLSAAKVRETVEANLKATSLPEADPALLRETVGAALVMLHSVPASGAPNEYIQKLCDAFRGAKLAATQNVQRLQKTLQGLTQARSAGTPPPPDAAEKTVAAREALVAAEKEVSRLTAELHEVRRQYRELKAEATFAALPVANYQKWQERLKELEPKLTTEPPTAPPSSEEIGKLWEVVLKRNADLNDFAVVLKADREKLATYEALPKCPSKKCPHEQEAARFTATVGPGIAARELKLNELYNLLQQANDAHKAASIAAAVFHDWSLVEREVTALRTNIGIEDARIQNATEKALTAAGKLGMLEARGKTLADDLTKAEEAKTERNREQNEAQVQADRLSAARGEVRIRAQTEAELERAKVEEAVLKTACEGLSGLQTKLVESAVGPLMCRMETLCGPILEHPLEFRDGEIRYGNWTHRTASDSEKLTIYAALCFALAADCPLKLATISRFESFGEQRRGLVLRLASVLIRKGELNQLICVDVCERPEERYAGHLINPDFACYHLAKGSIRKVEFAPLT